MEMTQQMPMRGGILGLAARLIRLAESIPLWLPELLFRFGVGFVFFISGRGKLQSWDITLALFAEEYKVPVLPPEIAAYIATGVELVAPIMLFLGFGTRIGAALMLGMTVVIQLFILPFNQPNIANHLLWAGPLLYLVLRGPGIVSIDHFIRKALLSR